jgi:hypothetical protein
LGSEKIKRKIGKISRHSLPSSLLTFSFFELGTADAILQWHLVLVKSLLWLETAGLGTAERTLTLPPSKALTAKGYFSITDGNKGRCCIGA